MWTWTDAHKSATFAAFERWCNPMSCSNKACTAKGCAEARKKFCNQHGYPCPYFGDRRCKGDSCPGGLKTCISEPLDPIRYPDLPRCGDLPGGGLSPFPPTNTPPAGGKPPAGATGNCAQGNFMACLSEAGKGFGDFFTDASRTGGQQLPLLYLLGAGLLLVLLLKK